MPTCFIMMPITTPESVANRYSGDTGHFHHVLEHLFEPAVRKAGYEPIRPATTGADVIQGHIIRSIQSSDLVLCDATTFNPNVFFELGIRTALNLPAVIVRDIHTTSIPFDTGIINHHTYDGSLLPWSLPSEIEKLSEHMISTVNSSKGENPLWRHFGVTVNGALNTSEPSTEEKLDQALSLLHSLQQAKTPMTVRNRPPADFEAKSFLDIANAITGTLNAKVVKYSVNGSDAVVDIGPYIISDEAHAALVSAGQAYGLSVSVVGAHVKGRSAREGAGEA